MGVQYDIETSRFEFDFKHDGQDDIIHLMGSGYQVEAFVKREERRKKNGKTNS